MPRPSPIRTLARTSHTGRGLRGAVALKGSDESRGTNDAKCRRTLALVLVSIALFLVLPPGPAHAQDNTCQWSLDGECDEPGIGSGLCARGTDAGDCQDLADSCQFAFDGECDEPGIGTGLCLAGIDSTDCLTVANSCAFAHDGTCDEPGLGSGNCDRGTDAADCVPRAVAGPNSCEYAFDRECDEREGGGTGICERGTDTADCRQRQLAGGPDSCRYADDGECDEPGIGTGQCVSGTDTTDCRGISAPSNLVYGIQSTLGSLGYNPGAVDGQTGPKTRNAIHNFQRDYDLPQTGQATQDLLEALQGLY